MLSCSVEEDCAGEAVDQAMDGRPAHEAEGGRDADREHAHKGALPTPCRPLRPPVVRRRPRARTQNLYVLSTSFFSVPA